MNFLVRTYSGKCVVRPDITFNKNKEDYYVPDDVIALGWAPFVGARMSQAGKMISERFVGRYWDSVAFGIMLYPGTVIKDGDAHYCVGSGSCFDRTTQLPLPLYPIATLGSSENLFRASFDGKEIFCCSTMGMRKAIEDTIVECTLHSSARRGDYVCRELAPISTLCLRPKGDSINSSDGGTLSLKCDFCGNETLGISIFF